jgi:cytochrome c peroxidase
LKLEQGFIMKNLSCVNLFFVIFILSACSGDDSKSADDGPITEAALGKLIFDDHNLSANNYQACSTCHDETAGYTDPHVSTANPVSEGTLIDHFGERNTPTSAYARFSPAFSLIDDPVHGLVFSGGLFLDGRLVKLEYQA